MTATQHDSKRGQSTVLRPKGMSTRDWASKVQDGERYSAAVTEV